MKPRDLARRRSFSDAIPPATPHPPRTTTRFGPIRVGVDARVPHPRPWTVAQSMWAARLLADGVDGPVLELCAGVGHIGLAAVSVTPRDLVLVDHDETATQLAGFNARAARVPAHVEVRHGAMDHAVDDGESFAVILADPPRVPTAETVELPQYPLSRIDGGPDGLDVARRCAEMIDATLVDGGSGLVQLRDDTQVSEVEAWLAGRPDVWLRVVERRRFGHLGTVVRLGR